MRKILTIVLCLLCLTGCERSFTYTLDVSTGDTIEAEFVSTEGYNLTMPDGNLVITRDGETVMEGFFLFEEKYVDLCYEIADTEEALILEEGTLRGNEYVAWYDSEGYSFILLIENSSTAVYLNGAESAPELLSLLEALVFKVR